MAKVTFEISDIDDEGGNPTGDVRVVTTGAVGNGSNATSAERIGYMVGMLLVEAAGKDWDDVAIPIGKGEKN